MPLRAIAHDRALAADGQRVFWNELHNVLWVTALFALGLIALG